MGGVNNKYLVGVVMGSDSDMEVVSSGLSLLEKLGVSYRVTVASAHRTPERVRKFIAESEKKGAQVFIAAAGGAAHLPGVVAAETIKPVIGIPITSALLGLDSLLSIAQMPGGIPVAAMAIGKAGAKNAALLAVEIIALSDTRVRQALLNFRKNMKEEVIKKAKKIER